MLSKTTLWCDLMKSMLGPWWNLLQETRSLSILEHWCIGMLSLRTHSFPAKPTQFPLLALHKVDFSPSSPSVFDSISYPDSLSNLSLPLFLDSVCLYSQSYILHPPPHICLSFTPWTNSKFFCSAHLIFPSPHVISSFPIISLKLRRLEALNKISSECLNVRKEASQSSSHGTWSTLQ